MLFNSFPFLFVFLPIVLLGWWKVFRSTRSRLAFLTLASDAFYRYHEFPRGLSVLPLLLASTTTDYVAAARIARSDDARYRRRWLIVALTVNLGLLAFFKYLGFFEQTVDAILGVFGHPGTVPIHALVLPLGISFYTF